MLPLTTRQFPPIAGLEGFEPSNTRIKNECLDLFGYNPKKLTYETKKLLKILTYVFCDISL